MDISRIVRAAFDAGQQIEMVLDNLVLARRYGDSLSEAREYEKWAIVHAMRALDSAATTQDEWVKGMIYEHLEAYWRIYRTALAKRQSLGAAAGALRPSGGKGTSYGATPTSAVSGSERQQTGLGPTPLTPSGAGRCNIERRVR